MDTAWTLQLIQGILAGMDQIQAQIQSVRDNHDQFNAALLQQLTRQNDILTNIFISKVVILF